MKRLILACLFVGLSLASISSQADITRFYDHCGQLVALQIGNDIFSMEYINSGVSEDHASRIMAEAALIEMGQAQMYDIDLKVFFPDMRCS